jgi:two-component system LytT family response regulator
MNMHTTDVGEKKLALHTQEGDINLALKTIIRLEGERNYSCIYLAGGKRVLASKTLGEFEELLEEDGFFRCINPT